MARPLPVTSGSMPLGELLESTQIRAAEAFGMRDLDQLLRFAPRRYVVPAPLGTLREVPEGEEVSAVVTVESVHDRRMRRRPGSILEAQVTDGADRVCLTFFLGRQHLVDWHRSQLVVGRRYIVRGTVGRDSRSGALQITHPAYEEYEDTLEGNAKAKQPLAVYPLKKSITQDTLREAMRTGLEHAAHLTAPVPAVVQERRGLVPLVEAVRRLHRPRTLAEVPDGTLHLAYEEAFILQAIFAQRREQDRQTPAPALTGDGPLRGHLDARLPFTLTAGQLQVGEEIDRRLAQAHPTSALLQGDVGSGKTIIALRAMLRAVDSGHQAALLAPTEVLAEQHHRTITQLMGELARGGQLDGHADATRVRLLTGSQSTAGRRETLLDVTSGQAGIVIGTHALLTDSVEFAALGLVVIDEQHRFGVDHRRRLRTKGPQGMSPHVVVMTATPIPRTAALATVGDLDVLDLRERPGIRAGVTSYVVHEDNPRWQQRMWARAGEEIAAGRQVFVVCPRIDEDEAPDAPAPEEDEGAPPPRGVLQTARRLAEHPELAGARIGVLHGRLPAEDKQRIMDQMVRGDIDLLIATTVIEVGVDMPNASVMIVLDAERFGVSQLHQLRGRVGRGEHPGIAFLETRARTGSATSEHLAQIAEAADGFALAQLDLRRRGAGDLVGAEQSGLGRTLRHLDVIRDASLIEQAREDAFAIVEADPGMEEHQALRAAIDERLRDADPDVERS